MAAISAEQKEKIEQFLDELQKKFENLRNGLDEEISFIEGCKKALPMISEKDLSQENLNLSLSNIRTGIQDNLRLLIPSCIGIELFVHFSEDKFPIDESNYILIRNRERIRERYGDFKKEDLENVFGNYSFIKIEPIHSTAEENYIKSLQNTFTDPRDGKVYKTVKIGNQVWMAENLNYDAPGSKCYDNDPKNAEKYGRLYDWETAMKAAPPGWHLPSDDEWQTLVDFAGGSVVAGAKLKAKSGWHEGAAGRTGNGMDEYGFSALPDDGFGRHCSWWTGSEYNAGELASYRYIDHDYEYIDRNVEGKEYLFSVRCVRN